MAEPQQSSSAEKDAGYPTKWPLIRLECGNHKCRVEVYAGVIINPLNCCPVCGTHGTPIPPGRNDG